MEKNRDVSALVGRVLLALMFVLAGYGKITGFDGTAGYIASKGLPLPQVGAAIAVVVELVGGLLLIVGWKARWVALVLAIFTAAATYFFHDFWHMTDAAAVIGGMLMVWAMGPGRLSIDRE